MSQKELLGFKLISNFETFADFHTIVGQKLGKLDLSILFLTNLTLLNS